MKWKPSYTVDEYKQLLIDYSNFRNNTSISLYASTLLVSLIYGMRIDSSTEEGKKVDEAFEYLLANPDEFVTRFFEVADIPNKVEVLELINSLDIGFYSMNFQNRTGFYYNGKICLSASIDGTTYIHTPNIIKETYYIEDNDLWFIINHVSKVKDYYNSDIFGKRKIGPFSVYKNYFDK